MQVVRQTRDGIFTAECVRDKQGKDDNVLSRLSLTALVIAAGLWIAGISSAEELLYEPDVVLVMKDKVFHVVKGYSQRTLRQIQPSRFRSGETSLSCSAMRTMWRMSSSRRCS